MVDHLWSEWWTISGPKGGPFEVQMVDHLRSKWRTIWGPNGGPFEVQMVDHLRSKWWTIWGPNGGPFEVRMVDHLRSKWWTIWAPNDGPFEVQMVDHLGFKLWTIQVPNVGDLDLVSMPMWSVIFDCVATPLPTTPITPPLANLRHTTPFTNTKNIPFLQIIFWVRWFFTYFRRPWWAQNFEFKGWWPSSEIKFDKKTFNFKKT